MKGANGSPPSGADLPDALDRNEVLRILEGRGDKAREELSRREDASPEVLFFLAAEGTPEARRCVAANRATPAQANRVLAADSDGDVRAELARKIGRLLPDLPIEAGNKLRTLTIETLEVLAQDQLPRVRQILAEEIKTLACVPKTIIDALARDVELVAAPILEYSPLLSDADLIDIVTTAQARHALVAIARRQALSASVSDAIAKVRDIPSVAALLENSSAEIRERTMEKIVAHAARIRDWHRPLVQRPDLSQRAIRRIAGFVSSSLIERLCARHGLDDRTRLHLKRQMRARLEAGDMGLDPQPGASAMDEIVMLHSAGKLDDAFVARAADAGRRECVMAALAVLARVSEDVVSRIFQAGSAKPVTSLVWRAGLSMRAAFKIQNYLLHLPARELLPARDGVRFPLSEDEMRWHLGYFGISV
jgi:uncharacterized protein (DUF2336 family)